MRNNPEDGRIQFNRSKSLRSRMSWAHEGQGQPKTAVSKAGKTADNITEPWGKTDEEYLPRTKCRVGNELENSTC